LERGAAKQKKAEARTICPLSPTHSGELDADSEAELAAGLGESSESEDAPRVLPVSGTAGGGGGGAGLATGLEVPRSEEAGVGAAQAGAATAAAAVTAEAAAAMEAAAAAVTVAAATVAAAVGTAAAASEAEAAARRTDGEEAPAYVKAATEPEAAAAAGLELKAKLTAKQKRDPETAGDELAGGPAGTLWHACCGHGEFSDRKMVEPKLRGKLAKLIGQFVRARDEYACADPFVAPVTVEIAGPLYFDRIRRPMDFQVAVAPAFLCACLPPLLLHPRPSQLCLDPLGMRLQTMMNKLSRDDYPKLSELVGDVELTLRNCRTFNQEVECAARYSCSASQCTRSILQNFIILSDGLATVAGSTFRRRARLRSSL
jgi:hypothetical protein